MSLWFIRFSTHKLKQSPERNLSIHNSKHSITLKYPIRIYSNDGKCVYLSLLPSFTCDNINRQFTAINTKRNRLCVCVCARVFYSTAIASPIILRFYSIRICTRGLESSYSNPFYVLFMYICSHIHSNHNDDRH